MTDEQLLETTIDRRVIHKGRYLTFEIDRIRDARGMEHTRDLVRHPGAVAIIPLFEGDVLMVRQYRTPIGRVLLELPAGTLDPAPGGGVEEHHSAAIRELGEETGYAAATWRLLGSFYTAPGFATELMHLYLATNLSPIADYAGPMEDERLELRRVPWREAVTMAERGEIDDAKSICGLFWLDRLVARGEITVE
jgi:ADP-ribose pyrophosphatase